MLLGHGSGGRLTADLIEGTIVPALSNPLLDALDDQAVLHLRDGARVAFTTDSYVVSPIFFPGGDIGELAVNGTINDLAVGGARPLALSLAFILEEGFPLEEFRRVVDSVKRAAARARRPDRHGRHEGRRSRLRRRRIHQHVGRRRRTRRPRSPLGARPPRRLRDRLGDARRSRRRRSSRAARASTSAAAYAATPRRSTS